MSERLRFTFVYGGSIPSILQFKDRKKSLIDNVFLNGYLSIE